MNNSTAKKSEGTGYLAVRVSTARGAIPLENAAVSIRGGSPENSGIVYSLTTDRDGLTRKVELPTPPIEFSESPGNPTPFSSWNIDVFKEGYAPVYFQSVPVYPSVISIQGAVMIPLAEGFRTPEIFNESQEPTL